MNDYSSTTEPTNGPTELGQHLYRYEFRRCECGGGPDQSFRATVAEAQRILGEVLGDESAAEDTILGTGSGRITIDPPPAWTDQNGSTFPKNSVLKLPVYTKAPRNDGRVQNRLEQLIDDELSGGFSHIFAPIWESHPEGWWTLSKRFETGPELEYDALHESIQEWAIAVSGQQLHPESEFLIKDNLGVYDISATEATIIDYGSHHPEWFIQAIFEDGLPFDPETFREPLPEC